MKRFKQTNGMYSLVFVVMAFLAAGIYFACSADDDFTSNYELETNASGTMPIAIESETDFSFTGVIVDRGSATFNQETLKNSGLVVYFTVEWDSGYTGNIKTPFSHARMSKFEGEESSLSSFDGIYKHVYTNLTCKSCSWDRSNNMVISYSYTDEKYYIYGNTTQLAGTSTCNKKETYTIDELKEHSMTDITDD